MNSLSNGSHYSQPALAPAPPSTASGPFHSHAPTDNHAPLHPRENNTNQRDLALASKGVLNVSSNGNVYHINFF